MHRLRIILGMIARHLRQSKPITDFLENALQHGHSISRVIVSVSGVADAEAVKEIEAFVPLEVIRVNDRYGLYAEFLEAGLPENDVRTLFESTAFQEGGQMPFGQNRNQVVLAAIRAGGDVLFFVDSDVAPVLLTGTPEAHWFEPVDFFGSHLKALEDPEVGVSTSDYSGYYIIPPMVFSGLEYFLEGLGKSPALDFVIHSGRHHALTFDSGEKRKPFLTDKILGGNVAIRLKVFEDSFPFFSSAYRFDGELWLTRGEDTALGRSLADSGLWKLTDIDTRIFHDTFGQFPEVPDPKTEDAIRNRFYVTCLGWIGRNPILHALSGLDPIEVSRKQTAYLEASVEEAAAYFQDVRFLKLPDAAREALRCLPKALEEYTALKRSWPLAVAAARGQMKKLNEEVLK
jgi:hypothetical protein